MYLMTSKAFALSITGINIAFCILLMRIVLLYAMILRNSTENSDFITGRCTLSNLCFHQLEESHSLTIFSISSSATFESIALFFY